MLCSKIRSRTISFILSLTYLVNFYPAYSISPQKTHEVLYSDDSSESSGCYYSDSEGYYADSEGSSDGDTLLHSGEYPEKTSFSNPIPRRKNEKWSHCSSNTEETRIYFGESSESSDSSSSEECSGSEASPCFRKSSSSSDSSSSKKHSDSEASPSATESSSSSDSSSSEDCSGSEASPCFRKSSSSSDSSSSKDCSGSEASPCSEKSSESSLSSSSEETDSSETVQKNKNLNPELENQNLIMNYMIENVASHMADRAMIARQKIKCYIKDVFSDKSLYNQLSPELLVAVMCYWDRINYTKLINDTKDEKNELDRFFYTLITLLCLADKFAGDDFCDITALKWAWIGLVLPLKLIHYEKVLLENLDYRLYVSREDYLYYKEILKSCPKVKKS